MLLAGQLRSGATQNSNDDDPTVISAPDGQDAPSLVITDGAAAEGEPPDASPPSHEGTQVEDPSFEVCFWLFIWRQFSVSFPGFRFFFEVGFTYYLWPDLDFLFDLRHLTSTCYFV